MSRGTWNKLFNSGPQFPHLLNGNNNNNSTYPTRLLEGLNEFHMYKVLKTVPRTPKHSVTLATFAIIMKKKTHRSLGAR